MNFEDQTRTGFGKFSSGTSKRRVITALSSIIIIMILFFLRDLKKTVEKDPADLVNPLMGTDSEFKLSNGNT